MRPLQNFLLALVFVFGLVGTASAAEYNWSGFYIGLNAGYGWGKADSDTTLSYLGVTIPDATKPNGPFGGAQIGYNWQPFLNWVFGVEADWQASAFMDSSTLPPQSYSGPPICLCSGTFTSAYDAKIDWFGTVRGRIGYAWNGNLLYATGGFAYGEVKIDGTVTDSGTGGFIPPLVPFGSTASFGGSKLKAGWTLGGGFEHALDGNWSVKAEYLYLDLGSLDTTSPGPFGTEPVSTHTHFTENIVRVGLNYRFFGGR